MFVTNLLSSPLLPGLAYNHAPGLHTHSFTHSGPLTLGLGRLARMLAGPLAVQSPIPSSVVPVRASLLPVLLTTFLPKLLRICSWTLGDSVCWVMKSCHPSFIAVLNKWNMMPFSLSSSNINSEICVGTSWRAHVWPFVVWPRWPMWLGNFTKRSGLHIWARYCTAVQPYKWSLSHIKGPSTCNGRVQLVPGGSSECRFAFWINMIILCLLLGLLVYNLQLHSLDLGEHVTKW
jgi:hypothetical protein